MNLEWGGGTILIGVEKQEDDPFYSVKGIDDADKISSDIASQCASVFNKPIRPSIRTEDIDGKKVIIVDVTEAPQSDKPVFIRNKSLPRGAYRRIGSTDQKWLCAAYF
ncbi:MAG: ATP-binding protein [Alphaproteobacteria bacterium]|nr:ATP-binding protein [Alphaproteobacteria bacterium]